jgi:hypothetical protein
MTPMTNVLTLDRLNAILADKHWQHDSAEIRARAYISELRLRDNARWTYDVELLLRRGSLLQLIASRLPSPTSETNQLMQLGRFWEAVAGLPDHAESASAAMLSAISYEVAGSAANSAAVVRKHQATLLKSEDILSQAFVLLTRRQLIKLRGVLASLTEGQYVELGLLSSAIIVSDGLKIPTFDGLKFPTP